MLQGCRARLNDDNDDDDDECLTIKTWGRCCKDAEHENHYSGNQSPRPNDDNDDDNDECLNIKTWG